MPSLTDTKIRLAKPAIKAYSLQDGAGLYIDVRPTGTKIFRYRYWITPKKAGLYTIGEYPAVSLQDARREREEIRNLVKSGINPNEHKKTEKLKQGLSNQNTFEAVAKEWIEQKRASMAAYSIKQIESTFKNNVYDKIGKMPLKSITVLHVMDILKTMEKRGVITLAMVTRQFISGVFRYAVITQRADMDPAHPLKGMLTRPTIEHSKPMENTGIKEFIERLENYGGSRVTIIALWLLLHTFVRTVEARKAEWVQFDLEARLWKIPKGIMKKRREHIVPLSRQMIELLTELKTISGGGQYLFPSSRQPKTVISPTTINRALEYMDYKGGALSAHDFRATASTILHEKGYESEWVELQLAHVEGNKTKAAYNHAKYLPQRAQMMQDWSDFIDTLKPQPVADRAL